MKSDFTELKMLKTYRNVLTYKKDRRNRFVKQRE